MDNLKLASMLRECHALLSSMMVRASEASVVQKVLDGIGLVHNELNKEPVKEEPKSEES